MANLSLRIKANFDEANEAFGRLRKEAAEAGMSLGEFTKKFADKKAEEFAAKQKQASAAVMATRGEIEALTAEKKAYQREIERLMRAGLDPQSDAMRRLQTELDRTQAELDRTAEATKRAAEAAEAKERALKAASAALLAVAAAAAAAGAALMAAAVKTAEAGDRYAKTARQIGMTAERLQELEYVAAQSGVASGKMADSLQRLNRNIGDLRAGSGRLYKQLSQTNRGLLNNLRSARSNEQAFDLLMDAVGNASDEFERAALAYAAFGRSGAALINVAELGAEGIAELSAEARRFGIITNEQARQAELFADAQTRLTRAFEGARNEIGSALIPALTAAAERAANFIAGIDDWEGILQRAAIGLSTAGAALSAFVAVANRHAIITAMTKALAGLKTTLALMKGPAGLAALAVGGLTLAITAFATRQREVVLAGERVAGALADQRREADELLAAFGGLNPEQTLNAEIIAELIRLYPELSGALRENETTVREVTAAMSEIDYSRAMLEAERFVNSMKSVQRDLERIEALIAERSTVSLRNTRNRISATLDTYRRQANAILETVGKAVVRGETGIYKIIETYVGKAARLEAERAEERRKQREREALANRSMAEKLNEDIYKLYEHYHGERINQVRAFLNRRADLERAEGAGRIASVERELGRILAAENFSDDERRAAREAAALAIADIRERTAADEERARIGREREEKEAAERRANIVINALNEIGLSEKQAQNERIDQVRRFLQERVNAEKADSDERTALLKERGELTYEQSRRQADKRIEFLKYHGERVIEELRRQSELAGVLFDENSREYLAARAAVNAAAEAEEESHNARMRELAEARAELRWKEVEAAGKLLGAVSSLFDSFRKENRALFIASRVAALAQAAINTAVAISHAIAQFGPPPSPAGIKGIAAAAATGAAAKAKIISTMIPSAETGGRFVVPPSAGVDGTLMRLNRDEVAEITPRGMTDIDSATFNFALNVDGQAWADITNFQAKAGRLYSLQLAGNL